MKKIIFSILFVLMFVLPAEAGRYGIFENRSDMLYSGEYEYIKSIIIALLFYIIIWLDVKHNKKTSNLSCKIFRLENEISNISRKNKNNKLLKEEYMRDSLIMRENLLLYFDDIISKEELLDETFEVLDKEYDEEYEEEYADLSNS